MIRIEAYKEMARGNKICHKSWIGTGKHCYGEINSEGRLRFFFVEPNKRVVEVNGHMSEPDCYIIYNDLVAI